MKTTLTKVLNKAAKKVVRNLPSISVVTEDDYSATIRTNTGSSTMDYTTTMTPSPKPEVKKRYLSTLP